MMMLNEHCRKEQTNYILCVNERVHFVYECVCTSVYLRVYMYECACPKIVSSNKIITKGRVHVKK